mmetsp:Transcript_10641/g.27851  ORF Transcript_10641/g.27851 Transcript_10641/m.27851 type:complete len:119 (+) Transcript_10641:971-1327(+)
MWRSNGRSQCSTPFSYVGGRSSRARCLPVDRVECCAYVVLVLSRRRQERDDNCLFNFLFCMRVLAAVILCVLRVFDSLFVYFRSCLLSSFYVSSLSNFFLLNFFAAFLVVFIVVEAIK